MDDFNQDIQLDEENQGKAPVENQGSTENPDKQQKIGEKVDLTSFSFSQTAHPTACFFHTFFKLLAIFTYQSLSPIQRPPLKTKLDIYLWDFSWIPF
jgi:hypothetical protein